MEIPQSFKKRNEFGLKELPNGQEYKFKEDGSVSWEDMIPSEFLFANKSYEKEIVEKTGKPLSETPIHEIDKKYRLSTLAGVRHVANLRGYSKVEYSQPVYGANGAIAVECKITWLPNYETEGRELTFSGLGEATQNNASPIGKNKFGDWAFYLVAIAENRAFLRACKIGLNFDSLLIKEEMALAETVETQPAPTSSLNPHSMLQDILDQKKPKVTLDILKKTILNHYRNSVKSDPNEWASLKDIPPNDVFSIITLMKKEKTH